MVHKPRCPVTVKPPCGRRVACTTAIVVLVSLGPATVLFSQEPGVHYLHQGVMPPGAIGSRQLLRGGPLPGFFQPVEIRAPSGALVSLASQGRFAQPKPAGVRVGMLIGQVYRLRVMKIPRRPGAEVFPTIEVIDRLYAPQGQQRRFAIPVELTQADMELALEGKYVTRVIYLEDPRSALPVSDDPQAQNWFEAGPGRDPLAMADVLGRPVAILRLGARLPDTDRGPDADFLFGCPPFVEYPRATAKAAKAAGKAAAAEPEPEKPQP